MTGIRLGENLHESAVAAVKEAIPCFAAAKNVFIEPNLLWSIAEAVVDDMAFSDVYALCAYEPKGAQAAANAINRGLNIVSAAQVSALMMQEEGKEGEEARITRVAAIFADELENPFRDGACRWPESWDFVRRYYEKTPFGPVMLTADDGAVLETYWLGGRFHRDPKEGPAWRRRGQEGESWKYFVSGELHRDWKDGAALHVSVAEGTGLIIEEYYENGTLHRPVTSGPARTIIDANGKVLFEGFFEQGLAHRDPRVGPALWWADAEGTGAEYFVNGQLHREQRDGPALLHSDAKGRCLLEIYAVDGAICRDPKDGPAWYGVEMGEERWEYVNCNGVWHRDEKEGPAVMQKSEHTGVLVREEYYKEGVLHRECGPAVIWRDEQTGCVTSQQYFREGCEKPPV